MEKNESANMLRIQPMRIQMESSLLNKREKYREINNKICIFI